MIALTGVTGKLGGQLASRLSQAGVSARMLARRPEAVDLLANMQIFEAYYDASQTTLHALAGVDILFMVSGREAESRIDEHKALIDAAKLAGVRHIIYTGFYHAEPTSTFTLARDHAETERYIKELGFTYTFIRDNFYMDFFVELAKEYGELKGPAGNGKVSMVARKDVVDVAFEILCHPQDYENRVFDMTGPEELMLTETATIIGQAWNKEIPYINETVEEAYRSRLTWPAQQWQYDSWVSTYTAIANGELSGVSTDIFQILGRPATSLAEFLQK